MNIATIIQAALTALKSSAEVLLLEQSRAENEELNHITDVVIIYPDWSIAKEFSQGLEINSRITYNIVFKTQDEWDNSDNNTPTSYQSKTSVDRINNMEILCDSVMWWIANNMDLYDEIIEKPSWTIPRPLLRENNGTMSGVRVRMSILYKGQTKCDFS